MEVLTEKIPYSITTISPNTKIIEYPYNIDNEISLLVYVYVYTCIREFGQEVGQEISTHLLGKYDYISGKESIVYDDEAVAIVREEDTGIFVKACYNYKKQYVVQPLEFTSMVVNRILSDEHYTISKRKIFKKKK